MSRAIKSIQKLLDKGRVKPVLKTEADGKVFVLGYRRPSQPEHDPKRWELEWKKPQLLHDPHAPKFTEVDVDGPPVSDNVTYGQFLKLICDEGVKDAEALTDSRKRLSTIDGFTACRGKTVDDLRAAFEDTQKIAEEAKKDEHQDALQYEGFAGAVATVCTIISVLLKRTGLPEIVPVEPGVEELYARYLNVVAAANKGGEEKQDAIDAHDHKQCCERDHNHDGNCDVHLNGRSHAETETPTVVATPATPYPEPHFSH